MSRYNDSPVQAEKIQLIKDLLSHPPVNYAYLRFVELGNNGGSFKEREIAFNEYCRVRDLFLGLPRLNTAQIHQEQRRII